MLLTSQITLAKFFHSLIIHLKVHNYEIFFPSKSSLFLNHLPFDRLISRKRLTSFGYGNVEIMAYALWNTGIQNTEYSENIKIF